MADKAGMMKPDELGLLSWVYDEEQPPDYTKRFSIFDALDFSPKRLNFILEKWEKKGYWKYELAPEYGWLTPGGKEWAAKLLS